MRSRYQRGCVTKLRNRYWLGLWWEAGHRRSKVLGEIRGMTKSEARRRLEEIMAEVRQRSDKRNRPLAEFITRTFLPIYERRWKDSTAATSKNRIEAHIVRGKLGALAIAEIGRPELQQFLDDKSSSGLSYGVVRHLKFDLRTIFRLAKSEGLIAMDPCEMLHVVDSGGRERRVMTMRQVAVMLAALDTHDLLVAKLATICGMRPGEIFGLQWRHYHGSHVEIEQRVYAGKVGSPKTRRSRRKPALSRPTRDTFELWRSRWNAAPDSWVFPSEDPRHPERPASVMRATMGPALSKAGLGWVTFQVMRRTHASLMRELGQDPKTVSDQLGHTVGIDLNVYAQTSVEHRSATLEELEAAISREESRQ